MRSARHRSLAEVEGALRARLDAVADILLPEGVDGSVRTVELLHRLALAVKQHPSHDKAWLLFAAISGSLPESEDVTDLLRRLDLIAPSAVVVAALGATFDAMGQLSDPARRLRLVQHAVVVDVNFCATHEHNTGIQRVVREAIPRWIAAGKEVLLAAWTSDSTSMRPLDVVEQDRVLNWYERRFDRGLASKTAQDEIIVPWRSVIMLPEVPLGSLCTRLAALAEHSGNAVTMIGYDAIPLVSAEGQRNEESERFARYLAVVKHSERVIAISESAAEEFRGFVDALATQGIEGPSVEAVPLAVEVPKRAHSVAPAPVELPLMLCVGSHEPRKNQEAVLAAATRVWRAGHRFELVFVGGGSRGVTADFDRRVRRLARGGFPVRSLRGVGDVELWSLYSAARFTAFVSLHEGFGLPVAESLALGVPVLTSDYGALAEIGSRGGCLLVDPRDDEAISDAIERLMTDDSLVARLRAEAEALPERGWDDYADELWAAAIPGLAR